MQWHNLFQEERFRAICAQLCHFGIRSALQKPKMEEALCWLHSIEYLVDQELGFLATFARQQHQWCIQSKQCSYKDLREDGCHGITTKGAVVSSHAIDLTSNLQHIQITNMRLINTAIVVAFLAISASARWPDCPIEAETPGCTCDDLIDYYCGLGNCPNVSLLS